MMSRSRTSLTVAGPLLAALGVERLDHLVGDVDLRAPEHGLLQDQVVLLGLEDLLDDAVGALDDGGELLVLALAEVFLRLATLRRAARVQPYNDGIRQWIGAITVPNTRSNLAAWISDSQRIKPGNLMPPIALAPDDLNALVDYLEGLK